MGILLGLLTLIASILVPVLILFFTGFEILHFSVFFVVPAGALFIGYACGYGYYKGLIKSNIFITWKQYLIGIILSIICIFGIEYASYLLTCVNPQTNEIVYSLDGDHISNYYVDEYGQLDFFTYTKFMVETTPITFSHKTKEMFDVSGATSGWIFYIIDFLGIIIGGLVAGNSQKDKFSYCHTCKLYKNKKELFRLPKANGEEFFEKLEDSLCKNDMGMSTNTLLNTVKMNQPQKDEEYYLCELLYCKNCKTASLNFELYEFNSKKKLEKSSDFNYSTNINYDYLKSLITEPSIA